MRDEFVSKEGADEEAEEGSIDEEETDEEALLDAGEELL